MNSLVLFNTGPDNPLFQLAFRSGLDYSLLWPSALIICLLLGHAAYTDLFCGRIIRNGTSVALVCISVAILPFIYQDVGQHLIFSGIAIFFLAVFYLLGAVAEGDVKLYLGPIILLGKASLALFFISWVLILLYSIPIIFVTWRERKMRKQQGDAVISKFGQRLGAGPGGPGIAMAFVLTLWALGLDPKYVIQLLAVEAGMVLICYGNKILGERVDKAAKTE